MITVEKRERRGRSERQVTDLEADKIRALALTPVSRETLECLERYVSLIHLWQERINLIAPSTLPKIWTRHIADSLQLLDLVPENLQTWVDLGSGGGFPAIPIACALANRPGFQIHLVENNTKKAAFLREAIRITGVPAQIHQLRAENFIESFGDNVQVVSARALSPLKILCDQAFPLVRKGAIGLFLKGQDVEGELTEAAKYWSIEASIVRSKTSSEGCIVVIRGLRRRTPTTPASPKQG